MQIRLPLIRSLFIYKSKLLRPLRIVSDHVPSRTGCRANLATAFKPIARPSILVKTQRINKLPPSRALQPRTATASPAPIATQARSAPPLPLPPPSSKHVTFRFSSPSRRPHPGAPPRAPRQHIPRLASLQSPDRARRSPGSCFLRGGRSGEVKNSKPIGLRGGRSPDSAPLCSGAQAQSERPWGRVTSRTSSGLRGPPGGRAFPGEPEPPWGILKPAREAFPGAHKFPPHPRAGRRALLPPLTAPPLIPPSGLEQTTACPRRASALLPPLPGRSPPLGHYTPTPTQKANRVVRTPQTWPSPGSLEPAQGLGRRPQVESLWSRALGAHFGHPGRTEAGEAAAREGVQIQRGPRRLHPQARPASLLGDEETSPAPTFRGEEAAPPAAPAAAAAAAPHAQHQQERYPAQPPSHHPRRRRRLRAAAAAASAYCPRRLSPSGVRRASGRLALPLCALRAPPRSASGARRRAASSPSAAALTGADPEQLRRSPQDGP